MAIIQDDGMHHGAKPYRQAEHKLIAKTLLNVLPATATFCNLTQIPSLYKASDPNRSAVSSS